MQESLIGITNKEKKILFS